MVVLIPVWDFWFSKHVINKLWNSIHLYTLAKYGKGSFQNFFLCRKLQQLNHFPVLRAQIQSPQSDCFICLVLFLSLNN